MIGKIKGIKSGGSKINGIIEEANARGIITAGDFVKYINGIGENTQLSSVQFATKLISAIALDENRVFIAYFYDLYNTKRLYGTVVTIEEDKIIAGTDTQLMVKTNSTDKINSIMLSMEIIADNKVIIPISINSVLWTYICTIQDNEISIQTATTLSYSSIQIMNQMGVSIPIKLNNNKVLIVYSDGYSSSSNSLNPKLSAVICTITDTDIIVESKVQLSTETIITNRRFSAIKLNQDRILIVYSGGISNGLNAMMCTLNGTEITVNENIILEEENKDEQYIMANRLNENKVFIAYGYYSIYGMICNISNTTITVENKTLLCNIGPTTGYYITGMSTILINNKIYIIYNHSKDTSNINIEEMVISINENIINIEKTIILITSKPTTLYLSAIKLTNDVIFVANGGTTDYLSGLMFNSMSLVQKATSEDEIYGIATSKALEGQLVKVVRPNYNESEEN